MKLENNYFYYAWSYKSIETTPFISKIGFILISIYKNNNYVPELPMKKIVYVSKPLFKTTLSFRRKKIDFKNIFGKF